MTGRAQLVDGWGRLGRTKMKNVSALAAAPRDGKIDAEDATREVGRFG